MIDLTNELAFVKAQIDAQEKMMLKYADQPRRAELHAQTKAKFERLLKKLERIQIEEAMRDSSEDENHKSKLSPFRLVLADIEDAPPELMAELNVSESDRQEMVIVDIIDKLGGVASLDKIIVLLYKRTTEIVKRNTMTSRLYRMADKNMIFNVSGKRGFYSTYPLSDQEISRIFGKGDDDPAEPTASIGELEPPPPPEAQTFENPVERPSPMTTSRRRGF